MSLRKKSSAEGFSMAGYDEDFFNRINDFRVSQFFNFFFHKSLIPETSNINHTCRVRNDLSHVKELNPQDATHNDVNPSLDAMAAHDPFDVVREV